MWGYGHMIGYGSGLGLFGFVFQIIFWAVLIWLAVGLFRGHGGAGCCGMKGGHHHGQGGGEDAVEILKKRYAKGEITKEEFDNMKKDLES